MRRVWLRNLGLQWDCSRLLMLPFQQLNFGRRSQLSHPAWLEVVQVMISSTLTTDQISKRQKLWRKNPTSIFSNDLAAPFSLLLLDDGTLSKIDSLRLAGLVALLLSLRLCKNWGLPSSAWNQKKWVVSTGTSYIKIFNMDQPRPLLGFIDCKVFYNLNYSKCNDHQLGMSTSCWLGLCSHMRLAQQ